jgi:hypothetical protein
MEQSLASSSGNSRKSIKVDMKTKIIIACIILFALAVIGGISYFIYKAVTKNPSDNPSSATLGGSTITAHPNGTSSITGKLHSVKTNTNGTTTVVSKDNGLTGAGVTKTKTVVKNNGDSITTGTLGNKSETKVGTTIIHNSGITVTGKKGGGAVIGGVSGTTTQTGGGKLVLTTNDGTKVATASAGKVTVVSKKEVADPVMYLDIINIKTYGSDYLDMCGSSKCCSMFGCYAGIETTSNPNRSGDTGKWKIFTLASTSPNVKYGDIVNIRTLSGNGEYLATCNNSTCCTKAEEGCDKAVVALPPNSMSGNSGKWVVESVDQSKSSGENVLYGDSINLKTFETSYSYLDICGDPKCCTGTATTDCVNSVQTATTANRNGGDTGKWSIEKVSVASTPAS